MAARLGGGRHGEGPSAGSVRASDGCPVHRDPSRALFRVSGFGFRVSDRALPSAAFEVRSRRFKPLRVSFQLRAPREFKKESRQDASKHCVHRDPPTRPFGFRVSIFVFRVSGFGFLVSGFGGQSFLRQGVSLGCVGLNENLKDLRGFEFDAPSRSTCSSLAPRTRTRYRRPSRTLLCARR